MFLLRDGDGRFTHERDPARLPDLVERPISRPGVLE
jgi:hypothetical protein